MTKQQIIDALATTTDRPKAEVEMVVDSLLGEIGKALRSGERVDLRRFGSFAVKEEGSPGTEPQDRRNHPDCSRQGRYLQAKQGTKR
jgi:nucleoid DNA-binding protein